MNNMQIWAIFFAGIVSIKEHPRNEKGANIKECADIADRMFLEYRARKEHGKLWEEKLCGLQ